MGDHQERLVQDRSKPGVGGVPVQKLGSAECCPEELGSMGSNGTFSYSSNISSHMHAHADDKSATVL